MFTIAFKDLKLFFKDKKAVLLSFITPLGLITLLVFAFGGDSKEVQFDPIHLQVCDLDQSQASQKLIADLKKVEQLQIETPSENLGLENVRKGKRLAVLIIEKNFSVKLELGESALRLLYDAAREPEFGILQSILMGEIIPGVGQKSIKANVFKQMEESFGKMDSATLLFVEKGMENMFSGKGKSPSSEIMKIGRPRRRRWSGPPSRATRPRSRP